MSKKKQQKNWTIAFIYAIIHIATYLNISKHRFALVKAQALIVISCVWNEMRSSIIEAAFFMRRLCPAHFYFEKCTASKSYHTFLDTRKGGCEYRILFCSFKVFFPYASNRSPHAEQYMASLSMPFLHTGQTFTFFSSEIRAFSSSIRAYAASISSQFSSRDV